MFKRRSQTVETPEETVERLAGKGRPTPSRKEAEAARAARVKPPKDTKDARRLERQRAADARMAARRGMTAGDPKFLPAKDRGPVRLWIRNYVDSRFSPGELILPAAALVFALGFVTPAAYFLFYFLFLFVIFDSVVLARRVTHGIKEQFPDEPTKGIRMYAILRASQVRRFRIPRPAVSRRRLIGRKAKDA